MAVWSSLVSKCNGSVTLSQTAFNFLRNGLKGKVLNAVPVRHSHDRTLVIRTSTFQYFKFKNLVHLYLMVGIIPIVLVVGYVNIFIGPAQLALIPEGYEPKPWEYHKHPITRFFAKYLVPSPQELHERSCHTYFYENELRQIRILERKIKSLIKERSDYQAWYFEKPLVKYERKMIEESKRAVDEHGRVGTTLM